MRKYLALIVMVIILVSGTVWAAGSCVETDKDYMDYGTGYLVTLTCTGDSSDGSVPDTVIGDTAMARIKGKAYLYSVTAFPTSGGTAPDAADVTAKMSNEDLLGGKGTGIIHATATQSTYPYSEFMTGYWKPVVIDSITVSVANQATASANYTINLFFQKTLQ